MGGGKRPAKKIEWVPLDEKGLPMPKTKVKAADFPCPHLMDPGIPGIHGR
jgi:hypothetical protein